MVVFNSPTDDLVFKIIRDSFDYPKKTTRQNVMSRYDYVFRHDRAGRLVDAQSFEQLKFHRRCFTPALLETLRHHAAGTVHIDESDVVIRHAYVERRVIPLDVYLRRVDSVQAMRAVIDYGNAIKDLAVSDIFPGDMLLKNFGVTRLNRVVFYDYDELCALTECRFRSLSDGDGGAVPDDGHSLDHVDESDIFPEIFRTAMGLASDLRDVFMRYHGDLLEVDFWRHIQEYIRRRNWIHILPYTEKQRLARAAAGARRRPAARTAAGRQE
jgi:isocitrate dehydrogenase kinase/phosphatase